MPSRLLSVISTLGLLPRSGAFMRPPMPPTSSSCQRSSSSTLHASFTAAGAGGTPASPAESESESSAKGPVLQPTGTHHPFFSMEPLSEAGRWSKREGAYFNELIEANGGASVFKAHPGLAVTFLTDHASTEWFLSQPESVLDRQVRERPRKMVGSFLLFCTFFAALTHISFLVTARSSSETSPSAGCALRLRVGACFDSHTHRY